MERDPTSSRADPSSAGTKELLRRILAAVESAQPRHWVETACAVVLALSTMASAWCAYQSTLWGGVQTFRLTDAAAAARQASQHKIAALNYRAFDATMLIHYIEAQGRGDARTEEILHRRFRPEMRKAVDAWLATRPLDNPDAPRTPFQMAEYVQEEEREAGRREERAAEMHAAAQAANQRSDLYVLLTVVFASVMFFGGIGGTMRSRRLRTIVVSLALALFTGTVLVLAGMPVCRE